MLPEISTANIRSRAVAGSSTGGPIKDGRLAANSSNSHNSANANKASDGRREAEVRDAPVRGLRVLLARLGQSLERQDGAQTRVTVPEFLKP